MQMIMEAIGRIDGLEAMLKGLLDQIEKFDLEGIKKAIADLQENKADKKDLDLLQSEMRQKFKKVEEDIAALRQNLIKCEAGVDENKRLIERNTFRIDKLEQ
jgi:septal ring factor EnvC (AmiA/AmiB activator)